MFPRLKHFFHVFDNRFEDLNPHSWRSIVYRDFSAGLIVALPAIPMSMDFAIAMGLRPEQGIIAGAVACLVGRTFGRSKYQCGTDHTTRVNAGYFLFQRGLRLGRSLALPHDNQSDAGAATTSCCLAYYKSFSGVYPMPQSLYSHVLVPTNYEPGNQAAYRIAFAAAHSSKSVVSLLHVLPDQNLSDYRDLDAIHLLHRPADEKYGNWKKTAMEAAEEKARHLQRLRDEYTRN